MKKHSERRLKENEIIFREANKNIQEFVEEASDEKDIVVPFYCECSRFSCKKRINITTAEYKKVHKTNRHFIVLPGHEVSAIERILKKTDQYNVVQKIGEMPNKESINIALSQLAAE